MVISPYGADEYRLTRHVVHDEGTDGFADISEFSPVDEEEEVGEGTALANFDDPDRAVLAAEEHGGSLDGWVNQAMAADDYWRARHGGEVPTAALGPAAAAAGISAADSEAALRLPLTDRFFDLREVMNAVGGCSHLRWVLRDAWFNCDVREVWPAGHEYAEAESSKPAGLATTWQEMRRLAEVCHQVIDGRFTGYDEAGVPSLQLLVDDSTFWVVWSRDLAVLDRVRAAFPEAEPYDDPEEPRLSH